MRILTGRTFCRRSVVNLCHQFFCFDVMFSAENIFLLIAAISDSDSVFGLIRLLFFLFVKNQSIA